MTKNNGNGALSPDDLRSAAEKAIKLLTAATPGPYRLTEQDKGQATYKRNVIRASKKWRRRPVPGAETWPEFDDVASICGGTQPEAVRNGELLAAAPELLKKLARGVLQLQATTHDPKLRPSIGNLTPTENVVKWFCALDKLAQAFDFIITPDHELGDHPMDRMLGGTTEDRKHRAAFAHAVGDVLDPLGDAARKRKKNPTMRLDGVPTPSDILMMLPDSLREVLDMDISDEVEQRIFALDVLTQKKYGVNSNAVKGLIGARLAIADAWGGLEDHKPDTGTADLEDRAAELKEFYDGNVASAQATAKLLIVDAKWRGDNEAKIDILFEKMMKKKKSGVGLFHDLIHTDLE